MPRRQALPPEWNLEIIELRGRFYPVRVEQNEEGFCLRDFPHFYWDTVYKWHTPFACGPQPTSGVVSMGTWKLAFDFCQRIYEEYEVLYRLAEMAIEKEVYPERNVWYREALYELGAKSIHAYPGLMDIHCAAFVGEKYYNVCAWTVEDAIALLYQEVYEHVHGTDSTVQEEAASEEVKTA